MVGSGVFRESCGQHLTRVGMTTLSERIARRQAQFILALVSQKMSLYPALPTETVGLSPYRWGIRRKRKPLPWILFPERAGFTRNYPLSASLVPDPYVGLFWHVAIAGEWRQRTVDN